ncbi:hypothetical protein Q2941_08010 [Bradyrhizobium sp. UFLA05-153]
MTTVKEFLDNRQGKTKQLSKSVLTAVKECPRGKKGGEEAQAGRLIDHLLRRNRRGRESVVQSLAAIRRLQSKQATEETS